MASYEIDPAQREKILEQLVSGCETVLYSIKWVIALKKVKTMAIAGPDAGQWKKQLVDPIEKLVRIRAALLTLPVDLRKAIEDEATNRVECAIVQADILKRPPKKPWE